MSDVLLERLAKAAEGILAHLTKAAAAPARPAPAAGASGAAGASRPGAASGAAAGKGASGAAPGAAASGAPKGAAAGPKTGAPAAGAKAPGGKYTVEQVRDMIRKVATDPSLGKQSAADILADDGGGVTKVTDLKAENYDKVYEACQVLLSGEGGGGAAPAPEDDLM